MLLERNVVRVLLGRDVSKNDARKTVANRRVKFDYFRASRYFMNWENLFVLKNVGRI